MVGKWYDFLIVSLTIIFLIFGGISCADFETKKKGINGNHSIRAVYQKADSAFKKGNYEEAKKLYEEIIGRYENVDVLKKLPKDNLERVIFSIAHFQLSRVFVSLSRTQDAVNVLNEIIGFSQRKVLPIEKGAEAQIAIGNIYLKNGNVPLAIKAFKQVIERYPNLPHANAAEDAIKKTNKKKVAEICGVALLKGRETHNNITVSAFNGFSSFKMTTSINGGYCLPILESTPRTHISVFLAKDGYLPLVYNIFLGSHDDYTLPQASLLPIEDIKKGVLVGVYYKSIRGGKRKFHLGINNYFPKQTVKFEGDGIIHEITTDDNGIYMTSLPEGRYNIYTEQGHKIENINIVQGKTTIQNIFGGVVMVD